MTDHFLRPFSIPNAPGRHFVSGDGATITDSVGQTFLDAASGLWCANLGYSNTRVIEAIERQLRELPFYHGFGGATPGPAAELSDLLIQRAPDNIRRVFFGSSGSDANDTAIKILWFYNNLRKKPEKKKIISRHRGYHGVTVAAASCTGLTPVHRMFDLPLPGFLHVSPPDQYRSEQQPEDYARLLATEIDEMIRREGADTVAAFIAEPVMGTGGVLVPPETYLAEVEKVLRHHDVALVLDEVITGFGRLGTWFGAQRYGVEADIITTAKGLTGAYIPMSATLVGERIWGVVEKASSEFGVFSHGFTYSGHPVAAAAGLAALQAVEEDGLLERAVARGAYLLDRLRSACGGHPLVGDVRGEGLLAGIELSADLVAKRPFDIRVRAAARVQAACAEHGVLVRGLATNDVMAFSPPLIVSERELDDMIERFIAGLNDVTPVLLAEAGL